MLNTVSVKKAREDAPLMRETRARGGEERREEAFHAVREAVLSDGSISFQTVSTHDLLARVMLLVAREIEWCRCRSGVMRRWEVENVWGGVRRGHSLKERSP